MVKLAISMLHLSKICAKQGDVEGWQIIEMWKMLIQNLFFSAFLGRMKEIAIFIVKELVALLCRDL